MTPLIIGNGPINKSYGPRIDSGEFNPVIRLNHYNLEGYEYLVGTRTDIWAICGPMGGYERPGNIWPLFPAHSYDTVANMVARECSSATLDRFQDIDTARIGLLQHRVGHPWTGRTFTKVGITAIDYALYKYEPPVHILGFSFENNNIDTGTYKSGEAIPCHNDDLDKTYIESLIKSGKVIRL